MKKVCVFGDWVSVTLEPVHELIRSIRVLKFSPSLLNYLNGFGKMVTIFSIQVWPNCAGRAALVYHGCDPLWSWSLRGSPTPSAALPVGHIAVFWHRQIKSNSIGAICYRFLADELLQQISQWSQLFVVPSKNTVKARRRVGAAGSKCWNSLPITVRSADSLVTFLSVVLNRPYSQSL